MSEVLVVKLGGTTIADQRQVLDEIALIARKRPVVLVHGGGKRITEWLERLGVPDSMPSWPMPVAINSTWYCGLPGNPSAPGGRSRCVGSREWGPAAAERGAEVL